jgi:hypothetical protein
MSLFEKPFKKSAPPERIEPPPLSPRRTSLHERPGRVEPPSSAQLEPEEVVGITPLAENAFALPPETLEQEAERKFFELALKFNMHPVDLRSLETYKTDQGLAGIRGTVNGLRVDLRQEKRMPNSDFVEIVAAVGDRAPVGNELQDDFRNLRDAITARTTWEKAYEQKQDQRALDQMRGAA